MNKVHLNFWSRRWRSPCEKTRPLVDRTDYLINASIAREVLNLPQNCDLILIAAGDGLSNGLLLSVLHHLTKRVGQPALELVILAAGQPAIADLLGFKAHILDLNADLSLALAYSAADLLLALPTSPIAALALACKTPVVGFNVSGLRHLIDHQQNGYLAPPFDSQDLVQGIIWVLQNQQRSKLDS